MCSHRKLCDNWSPVSCSQECPPWQLCYHVPHNGKQETSKILSVDSFATLPQQSLYTTKHFGRRKKLVSPRYQYSVSQRSILVWTCPKICQNRFLLYPYRLKWHLAPRNVNVIIRCKKPPFPIPCGRENRMLRCVSYSYLYNSKFAALVYALRDLYVKKWSRLFLPSWQFA